MVVRWHYDDTGGGRYDARECNGRRERIAEYVSVEKRWPLKFQPRPDALRSGMPRPARTPATNASFHGTRVICQPNTHQPPLQEFLSEESREHRRQPLVIAKTLVFWGGRGGAKDADAVCAHEAPWTTRRSSSSSTLFRLLALH